jgi:hypothetical protein
VRIIASGYVWDARDAPFHRRTCVRTNVALAGDGTLYAAFRWGSARESPDGHEGVMASTDLGQTWEVRHDGHGKGAWDGTPGEVKGFEIFESTPGVLTGTGLWVDASDPEAPFIHPRTQGLLPMRIIHTRSADGGRTWGPRVRVETPPHPGSPCTHVFRLADGTLAQPYEYWKAYEDPSPARPGARMLLSHDDGATWTEDVQVASHPKNELYYWDQRLGVHPDTGELVAMFWTHDPRSGVARDVHIAWGSADGRSWTEPVATGLPGQHCQPIPAGGDRLLAVYSHRGDPPGIQLSLSDDFGHTWERSEDLRIYDSPVGSESGTAGSREQADLWNDMIAWRFGHPRGVLLPGGEVFLVYYAGDDTIKSARWARVGRT